MKISGSYTLPLPPERTYQMMQDPEVLARAIPGCQGLEKTGEGEYRMKMQMALASLSGAFEGRVRITDQTPSSSFRLLVEGAGRIGFVKGDGLLKLRAADGGTQVSYEVIKKFFEKFAEAAS